VHPCSRCNAHVSWKNPNFYQKSYMQNTGSEMQRKIAQKGNKTCTKHLFLSQNFYQWPILIFCIHVALSVPVQIETFGSSCIVIFILHFIYYFLVGFGNDELHLFLTRVFVILQCLWRWSTRNQSKQCPGKEIAATGRTVVPCTPYSTESFFTVYWRCPVMK